MPKCKTNIFLKKGIDKERMFAYNKTNKRTNILKKEVVIYENKNSKQKEIYKEFNDNVRYSYTCLIRNQ